MASCEDVGAGLGHDVRVAALTATFLFGVLP